ncbi:MAG: 50S ribosomal protein L11 methyltransferase [Deltaproteobacteria bacterium]|nr:50S ribosomal protein L11 methyltransferase [Deltaproteobacteria bacterium]
MRPRPTHQLRSSSLSSSPAWLSEPDRTKPPAPAWSCLQHTLLDFAASFKEWLKPNGFLILSGLLEEQEEAITNSYQRLGFQMHKRLCHNNWVSLWLKKSA